MKFVKTPNCPQNASTVLIAKNTPENVVKRLKDLGLSVLFGSEINYEVKPVSMHIDTQISYMGEGRFVASPLVIDHYNSILPEAVIVPGKSDSCGTYPDDCAYNIAYSGTFAIHNFKYTDDEILKFINCEKINISQGYSKCSICIVNEDSFITEDVGIAKSLKWHNINVLEISAGDISLPGFDYGFIGGASGKISKNILAFAGNIRMHRDYNKIFDFCAARGVELVSLSDDRLVDIGSIIPVYEKE